MDNLAGDLESCFRPLEMVWKQVYAARSRDGIPYFSDACHVQFRLKYVCLLYKTNLEAMFTSISFDVILLENDDTPMLRCFTMKHVMNFYTD